MTILLHQVFKNENRSSCLNPRLPLMPDDLLASSAGDELDLLKEKFARVVEEQKKAKSDDLSTVSHYLYAWSFECSLSLSLSVCLSV